MLLGLITYSFYLPCLHPGMHSWFLLSLSLYKVSWSSHLNAIRTLSTRTQPSQTRQQDLVSRNKPRLRLSRSQLPVRLLLDSMFCETETTFQFCTLRILQSQEQSEKLSVSQLISVSVSLGSSSSHPIAKMPRNSTPLFQLAFLRVLSAVLFSPSRRKYITWVGYFIFQGIENQLSKPSKQLLLNMSRGGSFGLVGYHSPGCLKFI